MKIKAIVFSLLATFVISVTISTVWKEFNTETLRYSQLTEEGHLLLDQNNDVVFVDFETFYPYTVVPQGTKFKAKVTEESVKDLTYVKE